MDRPLRAFSGVCAVTLTGFILCLCACAGIPETGSTAAAGTAAPAATPRAPAPTKEQYEKRGADAVATGDYGAAIDAYGEAGDSAALSALADKLLAAGSYELFVRCWQEARRAPVFQDHFADNSRGWNIRTDEYSDARILAGRLYVVRDTGDNTSFFWTEGGLDADADFSLQADVMRISGSLTHLVAISWGIVDADSNYQFGISGDGSYLFTGYAAGKRQTWIDWTKSAAIRTGYAENTIGVRRRASRLEFSINGQTVATAAFEAPTGTRVGFSVGTPIHMEVDSYTVIQYPSAREPLILAGDTAQGRSDPDSAIRLYAEAGATDKLSALATRCGTDGRIDVALAALKAEGLSEPRAHLALARLLAAAGSRAAALGQVVQAGWKLDAGLSRVIARETFSDNSRSWAVLNAKDAKLQVANGVYHVEAIGPDSGRSTWNSFPIDPDSDFRIQAQVKKLSGGDKETYSLIWGFTVTGEKQDFGVTGAGGFEYGYFENGKWHSVLKTASCPAVNPGNATNVLAVVREGDRIGLYINGVRVGEAPLRPFFGNNVGVAVYEEMAVEVDSLEITEYPPEFALDLARTELYGARPSDFTAALAAQYRDRGQYDKALAAYLSIGNDAGARECELRLGQTAAAGGDPAVAIDYYRKAGPTADACRGLVAAYEALGQKDKAEEPRASLANLLLADGKTDEALVLYRQLTRSTLQEAAGIRLEAASQFAAAAELFKAS
ncbi:MAG TPA: hypothetical protein VFI08_03565, partial [Spirochaetia bacterium]|nr:hypothetical protein [Spirochaetia bacterium]